jgi:hypothetical protein
MLDEYELNEKVLLPKIEKYELHYEKKPQINKEK